MFSSLVSLVLAVTVVSGATFYESPHNERAVPFYKVPVHRDFSSPQVYGADPVFAAATYKPAYPFRPEASFYKPQPQYGGYGHGASSYQTVNLAGGSDGHNTYF